MPKISVIVPVYNTEKYLHRCIDSILAQTFTDFELLLIDDGSKDNSGTICDEYAAMDSRVRVFHKENGGVSSARNLGLDNARGEWISFVDSDDWIEPILIESCIGVISETHNIDIIRYGYYEEEPLNKRVIRCGTNDNEVILSLITFYEKCGNYCYWGFVWNTAFKKDLIGELRFDENINYCEDHIFTYEYMLRCRTMRFLPLPLYHYQTFSLGLSCNKDARMIMLAAEKEFIIVSQIIGREESFRAFCSRLKFVIRVLYLYEKEYHVRKSFNKEFTGKFSKNINEDIVLQLYSNRIIPFLLKDILLRIACHYKIICHSKNG